MLGGGGGSGTQTTVQDVPEWAKPYYEDILKQAQTASREPYRPYYGARTARPTSDIYASESRIRNLANAAVPGNVEATNLARSLSGQAQGLGAQQTDFFSQARFGEAAVSPFSGFRAGSATPYTAFDVYRPTEFSGFREGRAMPFGDFREAQFRAGSAAPFADFREAQFRAGAASPFAGFEERGAQEFAFAPSRQFSGREVEEYMSPYMEQVVSRQEDEAIRQAARLRAGRAAQAVQAGAFGGSRQAVQEALADEATARQLGDIRASGLQTAYEQAARQFESDRAAQMSIQQQRAAEAARVQGISAGEAARVQQARAAELARTQGISIEEASRVQQAQAAEAARVQQARAAELARTQGISIEEAARVQQAQAGEAARVQQARAAELARTQGIGIEEAARVQAAAAAERSRVQGLSAQELARVQQAQAAEFARVQGISLEEAARVQQAQAAELARVQGISVDEAARVQAANAAEAARVQQATADSRMRQREFQLQTMGFSAEQARTIADLGERARAGDIQSAQLLEAQGLGQMARDQAALDIAYQDFLRQQAYPVTRLGAYSQFVRGLPVADAGISTVYQPQASPFQQALGAGISAYGLYRGLQ